MGNDLQAELRELVTRRRILAILGAGAAISAARNVPAAFWTGLLTLGAAHCLDPLSRPTAIPPNP
jgi:hypothetical protein